MTNFEIITNASALTGIEYDGSNLKTFAEWKKAGFSVKKGQKAVLSVELWKPFNKKVKDEKTGEEKTEKRFMLKKSALFSAEQVQPIEETVTAVVEAEETAIVEAEEVLPEVTEADVKHANFVRKPSNIKEVYTAETYDRDRYAVVEEVVLSKPEFVEFMDDLLNERDFLANKGGMDSTTVPEGIAENASWFDLTESQRQAFLKGAYRSCVRVTAEGSNVALLVDPSGHSYGRYVAVEGL